jgi:hypothetical protein
MLGVVADIHIRRCYGSAILLEYALHEDKGEIKEIKVSDIFISELRW